MIDYSLPVRFQGRTGETLVLRSFVRLTTGELATQYNVETLSVKVQKTGGTVTYSNDAVTPSTVLLDTPQLGDAAYDDASNDDRTERGYNLQWTAPPSAFPSAGWYTVRFTFTGADDSVTLKVFEGAVRGTI